MIDLLYALGVGLAFAIGVGLGAYLCRIALTGPDNDKWSEHRQKVEGRLAMYVVNTDQIAKALNKIAMLMEQK